MAAHLLDTNHLSPLITGIRATAVSVGSEAILGRDVLNHLIVTLNGLANVTEIAYE